jgi:hypothetical protein
LTRDHHPALVCHQEIDGRDRWRAPNRGNGWVRFFEHTWVHFHERRGLRRERQLEGIAKAKVEGKYQGRPATIDPAAVVAMKAQGLGATAIAKRLGIGRASVYRALAGEP